MIKVTPKLTSGINGFKTFTRKAHPFDDLKDVISEGVIIDVDKNINKEAGDLLELFPSKINKDILCIEALQNTNIMTELTRFMVNGKRVLIRDKNFSIFRKITNLLESVTEKQGADKIIPEIPNKCVEDVLSTSFKSNVYDSLYSAASLKDRATYSGSNFYMRPLINEKGDYENSVIPTSIIKLIKKANEKYFSDPQRFLYGIEDIRAKNLDCEGVKCNGVFFTLVGDELQRFKKSTNWHAKILQEGSDLTVVCADNLKMPRLSGLYLNNVLVDLNSENVPLINYVNEVLRKIVKTDKEFISEKDVRMHNRLMLNRDKNYAQFLEKRVYPSINDDLFGQKPFVEYVVSRSHIKKVVGALLNDLEELPKKKFELENI